MPHAPAFSAWQRCHTPSKRSATTTQAFAAQSKSKKAQQSFQPRQTLTEGDLLELRCDALAFGGQGVCRLDSGYVVLCERALPGEELVGRVTKVKKGHAVAVKERVVREHADAAEPPCPHFGPCGGCSLQSLQYEAQLKHKQAQVLDALERIGRLEDVAAKLWPIVPCEQVFRHRNKMQFSFGPEHQPATPAQDREPTAEPHQALGLHPLASPSSVLPINQCWLQHDEADAVLRAVAGAVEGLVLRAYDPATGAGLLRDLVIRRSESGEVPGRPELLLDFVTVRDASRELQPLLEALLRDFPGIVGVVNTVEGRGRERQVRVLWGRGHLVERLCGLQFRVSAGAFFQTNTRQAERLYGLVAEAAGLRPDKVDVVLDLFCGTGTIGLSMARKSRAVYGFDISDAAIADARQNAALNGIENAAFFEGDLDAMGALLGKQLPAVDVVVTDPGRRGMSAALVAFLRKCGARRLVYVSCNPATQARDLAALCQAPPQQQGGEPREAHYALEAVTPVDMFPHTAHVESVAVLRAVAWAPEVAMGRG